MGLQKRKIGESFFGKNHWKIAHGRNFAPKIFPWREPLLKSIVVIKRSRWLNTYRLIIHRQMSNMEYRRWWWFLHVHNVTKFNKGLHANGKHEVMLVVTWWFMVMPCVIQEYYHMRVAPPHGKLEIIISGWKWTESTHFVFVWNLEVMT
jgi:hypothetical protein